MLAGNKVKNSLFINILYDTNNYKFRTEIAEKYWLNQPSYVFTIYVDMHIWCSLAFNSNDFDIKTYQHLKRML
jgi:hypothetical protein